jgi:uncharacterized protein (DUF2267 family)
MTDPTWTESIAPDLAPEARVRLDRLVEEVTSDPAAIARHFPAAARLVARGPADADDPDGLLGPTLDDQARVALLVALDRALAGRSDELAAEVDALYRYGDGGEKRAVLRALPSIAVAEEVALTIVADGLRTNDARLVAAALGAYAADHLGDDAWRQGVLKCLFVGVPLAAVAGLDRRADDELARMVADFARERVAAGRDVPDDVWLILRQHPGAVEGSGLLDELRSPHPDRRAAAERALARRTASPSP